LKPYSTISFKVTVSNALGECSRLGIDIVNTKGKPNSDFNRTCSANLEPNAKLKLS